MHFLCSCKWLPSFQVKTLWFVVISKEVHLLCVSMKILMNSNTSRSNTDTTRRSMSTHCQSHGKVIILILIASQGSIPFQCQVLPTSDRNLNTTQYQIQSVATKSLHFLYCFCHTFVSLSSFLIVSPVVISRKHEE